MGSGVHSRLSQSATQTIRGGFVTKEDLQRHVRSRRSLVLMGFDSAALIVAYVLSILLRYGNILDEAIWTRVAAMTVLAVTAQLFSGYAWKVYRGRFGVASIEETIFLGFAAASAGFLVTVGNALTDPLWIARSIPPSATFLGLFVMITTRAVWRHQSDHDFVSRPDLAKLTLVVGAGFTGSRLAHSMLANRVCPEFG